MNVAKIIIEDIDNKGIKRYKVAEQIGIDEKKLSYKLIKNSITGEDLLKFAKVLNIDLNKLRDEIEL